MIYIFYHCDSVFYPLLITVERITESFVIGSPCSSEKYGNSKGNKLQICP